jgi:4-hydroxybutyryl-CoA dehydratase/vinylacetyl-CoA-Delta-isomerase
MAMELFLPSRSPMIRILPSKKLLHLFTAPLAHELLTMGTKAMHAGEEDYAICCAVPVGRRGSKWSAAFSAPRAADARDFSASREGTLPEAS